MADLSASLGIVLDEWQEGVLEAAMGERADGRWASRLVGVSAPRQQGKSQLIVARALAGVLLFDERMIICSAHQTDTAREVFQRLLDIIDDNPAVARRVAPNGVMKAINRESIRFTNGQVIKIKARSISGSRGFSADCLLLDEAQILSRAAWSSILPTMSARENPQAWLLGTPPTPSDDGEVFGGLRDAGTSRKGHNVAYLEWSAEPDDDFDDPETWARANPAFGTRISHEAVASERAAMSDEQFALERLGMWSAADLHTGVLPASSWGSAEDSTSIATDRFALGVEVGPDLAWASVALSAQRDDGDWHLELVEDQHTKGRGTDWLIPYVAHLVKENPQIRTVTVDVGGPIKALLTEKGSGRHARWNLGEVEVSPVKVADLGAGCSKVLDGIVTGWLHHIGQPQLSSAALAATRRALGDTGMWVWSRRSAVSDITPIQAGTLALIGAQESKPVQPDRDWTKDGGAAGWVM